MKKKDQFNATDRGGLLLRLDGVDDLVAAQRVCRINPIVFVCFSSVAF